MTQLSATAMLIKELRLKANLTQGELGEKVGVTKASISAYEKGKANPSDDVLAQLAAFFEMPTEDLRTGKGLSVPPRTDEAGLEEFLKTLSSIPYRTYKRVPLGARATFAHSYSEDYDFRFLEDFPVIAMPGDPEVGLVMDIDGDSMEPQLQHGMCVLVEPVPPVDGWKLARPGVYVVVYRTHFVVKRMKENTLATTGKVWLSSDNPDGGREEVTMDDLRGMWRVHRIVHAPVR